MAFQKIIFKLCLLPSVIAALSSANLLNRENKLDSISSLFESIPPDQQFTKKNKDKSNTIKKNGLVHSINFSS